ncbi:YcjF family protein [Mesobacterium pallidum]|uniref:YcjF family protein n=1 Tax=Mesobacterium pallidum TaxID=2872037 RepID=UPI001EE22E15|nr:TIGR01620 family protein [Mesobacterium pallidum]
MSDDRKPRGPVLIDLEPEAAAPSPADAPPVAEPDLPQARAMQTVAQLAAGRPSRLARLFWGLLVSVLGAVVSVAAWDFVTGLITRNSYLGYGAAALIGALLLVSLVIIIRELAAFGRLKRIDSLHLAADAALTSSDLGAARALSARLRGFYAGRDETRLGRETLAARESEIIDVDGLLTLAETDLLAPLDKMALREVEAAARQVALVTAMVPLALADVVAALTSNIRMIRRVAEIYGGRSGFFGSWRLLRAVMTHLVATGAVAVGDDMLGSFAGGGVLSKLSRRFGEGVVNGALTARVGVAAMEVCRPLPFRGGRRPSVSGIVSRALTGLFGQKD